jgi:hypothetical protein
VSEAARGPAVDYCPDQPEGHHMVSRSAGQKVRWVEICSLCDWIDTAKLDAWADNAIKEAMTARAQRIAIAAETKPFTYVQQRGEEITLVEILYQSLGAASVCWETPEGAGLFDSTRAKEIGEKLTYEVDRALLLAQTPWADLAHGMWQLIEKSTGDEEWTAERDRLKEAFRALIS